MSGDVTQILDDLVLGDTNATERLFPIVYEELWSMAQAMMRQERGSHTLQTTALVHEAYLRLVKQDQPDGWGGRGHFFSAAAESMRRILVDYARSKLRKKRGGDLIKEDEQVLDDVANNEEWQSPELILEVHEAIDILAQKDPRAAELIKLRFFAGISLVEAANLLGISKSVAYTDWAYGKAILAQLLEDS